MSEKTQREALKRARDARARAENARKRAEINEARGDSFLARLHRKSAESQYAAAENAETLIRLNQEVEGDQLEGER